MKIATLLIAATLLHAADGPQATIIPVKHLTGDAFDRLIRLLSVFNPVKYQGDETLRTIIVYGSPEVTAEMRRVVEALDRPDSRAAIGRNISMTLTFLKCDPGEGSKPVPTGMESVAKQLRAANLCRNVEVWDAVPLRLQEGKQSESNSRLSGGGGGANVQMKVRADSIVVKDSGRYGRFGIFNVGFRVPYAVGPENARQYQFMDVGINTAGDFKEGQKSVLGKVTGPEGAGAIFVVVELQVLD